MKKILRRVYQRVGRETFIRGFENTWRLICLILICVIVVCIAVCATCAPQVWHVPKEQNCPMFTQVETERIVWQTNPKNHREKIPVVQEVVYLVPNGSYLVGE